MDFGLDDIIQQTITKKNPPAQGNNDKKRKWISVEEKEKQRLAEVRKQEEAERAAKKRRIEEQKQKEKPQQAQEINEKDEKQKSSNTSTSSDTTKKGAAADKTDEMQEILNWPLEEIFKLLRELHQPITIFGESHQDRVDRLKTQLEMADEFTHKAGSNDLQTLLRQHEHSMNNIISSSSKGEDNSNNEKKNEENNNENQNQNSNQTNSKNAEQNQINSNNSEASANPDATESKKAAIQRIDPLHYSTPQGEVVPLYPDDTTEEFGLPVEKPNYSQEKSVSKVLKFLLNEWETYLMNRPVHILKSESGKHDIGICKQTRLYLEPLFKLLKKKKLSPDVLESLYRIVQFVREREYVKANDVYWELSIGNSPWPIGVTMVGIHARSARERIENSKIAHVLNDEETRKYIQSVKRLITFCQKRFPNPDTSKMFYGQ